MPSAHEFLCTAIVNRRGLKLALGQGLLLSSAHIPLLDGDENLISLSALVASVEMRGTHRRSHEQQKMLPVTVHMHSQQSGNKTFSRSADHYEMSLSSGSTPLDGILQ